MKFMITNLINEIILNIERLLMDNFEIVLNDDEF